MKKERRQEITIDGERTVELDYACLHPRLLYAREGLDLEGDAYEVAGLGPEFRNFCKVALNVLINARSWEQAVRAIEKDEVNVGKKDEDGNWVKVGYHLTRHQIRKVLGKLADKHSPISKYFGTGAGVHLQTDDSHLAMQIMLRMDREGVAAIPIHDSFIVQESKGDLLRQVMVEEYVEMFGRKPVI